MVVIVSLVTNAVGLVVLVPVHGATGAATAGIVGASLSSLVGVLAMSRVAATSMAAFVVLGRADVATVLREINALLRQRRDRQASRTATYFALKKADRTESEG
jgi:hypothetical protein